MYFVGVADQASLSSVTLQTNTEQCGMHIAVQSAAVHVGWGTAYLYGVQIFIGANVRHKASLSSTSEQWEMHFALRSATVHEGWVGAQLYELQIFIGIFVETQGCFQHG